MLKSVRKLARLRSAIISAAKAGFKLNSFMDR
jgi:hypothetical protein